MLRAYRKMMGTVVLACNAVLGSRDRRMPRGLLASQPATIAYLVSSRPVKYCLKTIHLYSFLHLRNGSCG